MRVSVQSVSGPSVCVVSYSILLAHVRGQADWKLVRAVSLLEVCSLISDSSHSICVNTFVSEQFYYVSSLSTFRQHVRVCTELCF